MGHDPLRRWELDQRARCRVRCLAGKSSAHGVGYLRLEAAWMSADRFAALRRSAFGAPRTRQALRTPPILLRVVAALVVVAFGGFLIAKYSHRSIEQQVYQTAVGERETVTLPDGSQIELNTDTVLRLAGAGNRRAVFMDHGEAYFRIKHNSVNPFVVMLGEHRVTDLGTEFVIRRSAQRLEVAVVEGRALFDTPSTKTAPVDRIEAWRGRAGDGEFGEGYKDLGSRIVGWSWLEKKRPNFRS